VRRAVRHQTQGASSFVCVALSFTSLTVIHNSAILNTMLQREMIGYIEDISDQELEALRPMLRLLASPDRLIIDTNLTDEERAMVDADIEAFKENPQNFKRII